MTAAFTMARQEEPFLRLWCNYYCRELGAENVWVLVEPGDETVAPATSRWPGIHVVELPAPDGLAFNERWRTDTVWEWQGKLLGSTHKSVIFSDTDELLIPNDGSSLLEYCKRFESQRPEPYLRAVGWNVIQDVDSEPAFERVDGARILENRKSMWRMPKMDKTLLVRQQTSYSGGFHHVWVSRDKGWRLEVPLEETLDLCHLQLFDLQVYLDRHKLREKTMPPHPDYYNRIYTCGEVEEAKNYFRTREVTWGHGSPIPYGDERPVPQHWKDKVVY